MKLGHFLKYHNRSIRVKRFLDNWDQWHDADVVSYVAYIPHHKANPVRPEMYAEEFALLIRTKGKKYIGILDGKEVSVMEALNFIELSKLEKLEMAENEKDALMSSIIGESI